MIFRAPWKILRQNLDNDRVIQKIREDIKKYKKQITLGNRITKQAEIKLDKIESRWKRRLKIVAKQHPKTKDMEMP